MSRPNHYQRKIILTDQKNKVNKTFSRKAPFWFFIILLIYSPIYGQNILRGVVTDSSTNGPLVGANVYLVGTALGSSTDLGGEYRISKIPPNTYALRISCVGYKPQEIHINITNGELIVNAKLLQQIIMGAEVLITAQMRGQVAAINQQISSNTIVNVISEEKIQELPDANAAEAIGRLPGVSLIRSGGEANKITLRGLSDKFGAVTVDGIRIAATDPDARGVDLSTISQGSLAGIELFKALTPDKDADAIAGSVNLVTKKAPSERLLRADLKGAYNKLNKTFQQYDYALRYGERFFNDIIGIQLTGNLERRDRSNERINLDYNTNLKNGTDYELTNFSLEFTNEIRKRAGLSLLTDINTPEGGSIKFNNIYNSTNRDYITYTRNYPVTGDILYGARNIERNINTYNSSLTGLNYFWDLTTTWGLSFAQSISEDPYDFSLDFKEPSAYENGQLISGMLSPPDNFKGPPELLVPLALNNFRSAYMNMSYYRGEKNLDKERTAFLDLSKKYSVTTSVSGELKTGAKYRYKNRSKSRSELVAPYYIDTFRMYARMPDGSVQQKNLEGTPFENLLVPYSKILAIYFLGSDLRKRNLFDQYTLYPMIDRDALRLWYELNRNGVRDLQGNDPEYKNNDETKADYYDIKERVGAGYLMNTLNFGQDITFISGIRVEKENNDYLSRYSPYDLAGFPVPNGVIKDTTVKFSETIWLPNFHLTVRPLTFLNVRLAVYKALARPDFNYRLEKYVARKAGTFFPGNSLVVGNPRLTAAKAWNFEINTYLYSNTIGLFSVSAFYKDIKHMYHILDGANLFGSTAAQTRHILDSMGIKWPISTYGELEPNMFVTYPYNSNKPTRVWGFEIEHQANGSFLPGFLKNIVLNYNVSIIRSETYITLVNSITEIRYIPGLPWPVQHDRSVLIEVKRKLEGQPELFGNIALGYDISGFSGRVSYFYQGGYDRSFSANGKNDQLVNSFSRWDVAIKQQISDHFSLTLNVNNITNLKESNSNKNNFTGWNLLNESELYGLTVDLGARITL
jgi:TonB-dependent receptor